MELRYFYKQNDAHVMKWVDFHYKCCIGMVVFITCIEAVGYFLLDSMGYMLHSPAEYIRLYIAIPALCNLCAVAVVFGIKNYVKNTLVKAGAVSLLMVFIVFIIYTIHLQYNSLCIGFAVAISVTIIYSSWKLIVITSVTAVAAKIISDVFIVWDTKYTTNRLGTADNMMNFYMSILSLLLTMILVLFINQIEQKKLEMIVAAEKEKIRLYEESMRDSLTGIYNRNGLRECMNKMLERRASLQYIFVLMDLDHFKHINDTYGHQTGDQYLLQLSGLLKQMEERQNVEAFRYGGDEFGLLFAGYSVQEVKDSLKKLQEDFLKTEVCRTIQRTSISIGGAVATQGISPSELVKSADTALYKAKQIRGSIVMHEENEPL